MINETQDATNIINQMDEKTAPSMSLGGGSSIVNLNAKASKSLDDSGRNYSAEPTKSNYSPKSTKTNNNNNDNPWNMSEELRQLEEAAKKANNNNKDNNNEDNPWNMSEELKQLEEAAKKESEPTTEKDKSHGDYKVELEKMYKEIESYQDQISTLEEYLAKINNENMKLNDWKDLQNLIDTIPKLNYDGKLIDNSISGINEKLTELEKSLSSLYSREKDILSNSDYDNRTDDQIRADKSTQLKVDDYIKAGLNPAGVGGYYGGAGGGGGSSSSNDEEERKRKKREKEQAEQREKERRQDMTIKMLGMLLGTGNALGSAGIRAKSFANSANIRNQGLVDNSLLKSNISDEAWYDVAEKYIPNLSNTGNIRNKPKKGVAFKEDPWLDEIIKNLK